MDGAAHKMENFCDGDDNDARLSFTELPLADALPERNSDPVGIE